MCSMANYRNNHNLSRVSGDVSRNVSVKRKQLRRSGDETRTLKRELGQLDQRERDYMENLANSLLKIQNADLTQKSEEQKREKRKEKRGK